MAKFNDFINSIDWEYESFKDSIFRLEREKDLEATWEQEEFNKKPAKIEVTYHETINRKSSFRRTCKEILFSRSRLFTTSD